MYIILHGLHVAHVSWGLDLHYVDISAQPPTTAAEDAPNCFNREGYRWVGVQLNDGLVDRPRDQAAAEKMKKVTSLSVAGEV